MPIMTKRTCDSLSMDATTVDVQLSSVTTNGDQVLDDRTTTDNDNNNSKAIQNQNQSSTDHEIKKVKYEPKTTAAADNDLNGQTKKSRVVHVRNIPSDTCDQDLIQLASGFGRVTNCLILRGKSQAFVEFLDTSSAQQMVNYWLQTQLNGPLGPMQPSIRGRHVFCQLSNHKELKTSQNGHSGGGGQTLDGHSENGAQNRTSEPSCVLRVVVENQLYQVSLDVLHQVFSRAGKVQKIVTFTKNQCFQALIQFESPREATLARQALDGQNLFHHANTLRIEFSKLLQLNVKYNNDKSRDYTNNQLPAQLHTPPTGHSAAGPDGQQSGFAVGADHQSPLSLLQQQQQSQNQNSVQTMFQMFSNPLNPSMRSLVNPFSALNALSATHAQSLAGQLGAHLGLGQQLAGHVNGVHGSGGGVPLTSAVLLVSNLNEATTTTDALFTLFGVYGDVIRVKILFNKKDNALIQMAEPAQAHLAQTYLDKVKLNGRVIRVTPSKHQLVQMPKEGQHDAGLTKDFSQSSLHRFKKPGSKNYGNIYPPSATLHLSNIPQSVQEEDIRSAFQRETNSQVVNFKFFPKDRKMALIQLPTVDDAIQALIKMHNYQLSESSHLRVSFSKSSI